MFLHTCSRIGFILLLAFGLVACSSMESNMEDSQIRLKEEHLLDAGFKVMIADTQEKLKMLNTLPPETITSIPRPDQTWYVYPDPKVCSCLYVGRQSEFEHLQKLAVEARISNQQLAAHELREDYQSGWGPQGAWGNFGNIIGGNNPLGHPDYDPQ